MPERRSMQGAVVVVALLCLVVGLVPAVYSEDKPHQVVALWPEPLMAIRGQSLRLNAWFPEETQDTSNCKLVIEPALIQEKTTTNDRSLSVMVFVPPTAPASLQVSATCGDKKLGSPVTVPVSWGLKLLLSYTMTPNPANKDEPLRVSLNLTNSGPRTAFNVECNFTAPGSDDSDSRVVSYPQLQAAASVMQEFNWTQFSEDRSLHAWCTSYDQLLLESNIDLLLKGDAKIQILPPPLSKVTAGESYTINTTISNTGRAKADTLNCTLSFDPDQVIYLKAYVDRCSPVVRAPNVTESVVCVLGDMNSHTSAVLPLELRINASVPEDRNVTFRWVCLAQGLNRSESRTATSEVTASFDIASKPNGYLTVGEPRAIHFELKNNGPSDLDEANCNFTATGVSFKATPASSYYSCSHEEKAEQLSLACRIHNLPASGKDLDLTLNVEDSDLSIVNITAVCSSKHGELTHVFPVSIHQASPSPSAPHIPQAPAPDNTMVVVVTVIVALGLLIVVVIWWRRKQDRAGWDENGPNGRRPSVNRFSDMELSVRSDD